jgi:hypothetical protein
VLRTGRQCRASSSVVAGPPQTKTLGIRGMRPNRPLELRDRLFAIFPDFRSTWEVEDNEFIEGGSFTYHGLMFMFRDYFTVRIDQLSEKQVRALADIFNEAVLEDDDLENAVSTVFLEHMHQLRVSKLFRPFLTAQAKRRSHA